MLSLSRILIMKTLLMHSKSLPSMFRSVDAARGRERCPPSPPCRTRRSSQRTRSMPSPTSCSRVRSPCLSSISLRTTSGCRSGHWSAQDPLYMWSMPQRFSWRRHPATSEGAQRFQGRRWKHCPHKGFVTTKAKTQEGKTYSITWKMQTSPYPS